MALRWYSIVIDSEVPATLARWWAEVLDWQIVYEAPDEVVIIPGWVDPGRAADTPWQERGPGMVFVPVPEGKTVKNRIHLDVAPHLSDDRAAEIDRLLALGATRIDVGQSDEATWDVFADPEGNEFCVLSSREM